MTLVLTLLTDDFIIHASDRQLTDVRTGRQILTKAAKTVICPPGMYMVSFTGLAQIAPPMPTGEWLMRTLWEHKNEDLFGSLAAAAANAIQRIAIPRAFKRHAFLVSGWLDHGTWTADRPLPQGFTPGAYATIVSNFHDPLEPGRALSEPGFAFVHSTRVLMPNQKFLIGSVGAHVKPQEQEALDRDISAALRSTSGGRERAAALLMVRTIQTVAERDATVGGGAFIAALPRQRPLRGAGPRLRSMEFLGVRWGLPEHDAITFVHIPDRPTTTVETPYVLETPFAGIGTFTIRSGPVPDLKQLAGIPEAGEMQLKIISWYDGDELARRSGSGAAKSLPTDPRAESEKS
jgi:hypothetical protein